MQLFRRVMMVLSLCGLAGCQTNDLMEPPVPLGNFALGLNIAVADNVQMVPISRKATPDEWEAAMIKAVDDRFGRYNGTKLYNIGIAVEGYALAPPGVPVVLKPRSILVVTANVWDDAAGQKLNAEGKQFHVFEKTSAETVVGSGLTQNKKKQMEILSYNAAKRVEQWFLENPEWFGLPPKKGGPAAVDETPVVLEVAAAPVPVPRAAPVVAPGAVPVLVTTPLPAVPVPAAPVPAQE